ncbi:hypothetical protein CBS101457_003701 [Exobasidium rhododendri]|nr:hypothetical protein CBS101457_003701 [Exobasidium rhododendri]
MREILRRSLDTGVDLMAVEGHDRQDEGEKEVAVKGYEIEDILRLIQLQRELYLSQAEIVASRASSDAILESDQGPIAKDLLCAEERERLVVCKAERDERIEEIKRKKRLVQERNDGINRRRARLEIARRAMAKDVASHVDLQKKLSQIGRQCATIRSKVYSRRVELLRHLEFIYPVELVDGATLLFSIVGIPLANRMAEDQQGEKKENDDMISSALGLIGQVVSLISVYLDTPIHYPIATAGSRSVIQDSISVMSGPRAFPLYSKGAESYRFEYAIFLLNKNIEQLLNHFGITILDIRNTLPNLKNLLVTLSASAQFSASRLSRKNLNGNETISLKVGRPISVGSDSLARMPIEDGEALRREKTRAKSSASWGMSLLGWSSVKESVPPDAVPPTSSSVSAVSVAAPIPVVRTIGSA